MTGEEDAKSNQRVVDRCDFCQSPIPHEGIIEPHTDTEYAFCTTACRDALNESERVFTEYRGHRWFRPEIAALDTKLPQGILRNSFVLLSAQSGTRDAEYQAELAWRALQRNEPVIYVTFREPPIAVVERFLTLDWNVLPALESGRLHFIDCFSYRVEDRTRMLDRMNEWNTHLYRVAEPEITAVRDPANISEIENRLDDATESKGMDDRGAVIIDSLTELGSLVQPVRSYNFVKDIRAEVCQARFIPIFAGATYAGDADQFPHDLEYMFDGIVDLEINNSIIEDTLIKRSRIRKMSGVLAYTDWAAYEFTSTDGLVVFDPEAERDQASGANETSDDTPTEPAESDS